MNLHYHWIRFRRECLRGRNLHEISAAKQMFYAGACAAGDVLLKNIDPRKAPSPMQLRSIEGLRSALIKFQQQQGKGSE